jgi:hypothetical protein
MGSLKIVLGTLWVIGCYWGFLLTSASTTRTAEERAQPEEEAQPETFARFATDEEYLNRFLDLSLLQGLSLLEAHDDCRKVHVGEFFFVNENYHSFSMTRDPSLRRSILIMKRVR